MGNCSLKKLIKFFVVSIAVVMLLLVPFGAFPSTPVAATGEIAQVKVTADYRQTVARGMLPILNNWRAGSNWYYNKQNSKVYVSGLKALKYDYKLEKYAMQRAAEIAVSFEHTRPNGGNKTGLSGYQGIGENIAATTNSKGVTADYAMTMFREDNEKYEGQGHRRMMLSVPAVFDAVGVGCVYYKNCYYWVQIFGVTSNPDTSATTAVNGTRTVTVDVDTSRIKSSSADLTNLNNWQAKLAKGQTDYLPEVGLKIGLNDTWPHKQADTTAVPSWSSSNSSVVKVDSDAGTITGVSAGSASVTMKESITNTVKSENVAVTDPNAVTGITLNKTELSLNPGSSSTLAATVSPTTASNKSVTWSSGNTSVATVSNSGVVTAVKAGTAVITAKTVSGGKTATCKVTVLDNVPTGVTLNKTSAELKKGGKTTLAATVTPSAAIDKTVKWSSSDRSVATVDSNGVVTGVKGGKATITATTNSGNKTAKCDVLVLFNDVDHSEAFFNPIYWAAENGITFGDSNNNFNPFGVCTREQVVTFIWRAMGRPEPRTQSGNPIKDVSTNNVYYKPILWAYQNGITFLDNKGNFNPYGKCTREQVVTYIWRIANRPQVTVANNPITDVKTDNVYYKAILWAQQKGITYLDGKGRFNPYNTCTRRETVTFIYRYFTRVKGT